MFLKVTYRENATVFSHRVFTRIKKNGQYQLMIPALFHS